MASKEIIAGGPVLLGVAIALTEYMQWNGSLHYLWAAVAVVWGIWAYMQK